MSTSSQSTAQIAAATKPRIDVIRSTHKQQMGLKYTLLATLIATVGCAIAAYILAVHGGAIHPLPFLVTVGAGSVCLAGALLSGVFYLINRGDRENAINNVNADEYTAYKKAHTKQPGDYLDRTSNKKIHPSLPKSIDEKLLRKEPERRYRAVKKYQRNNTVVKWAKRAMLVSLLLGAGTLIAAFGLATTGHGIGAIHAALGERITFISGFALLGALPLLGIVAGIFAHDRPQIAEKLGEYYLALKGSSVTKYQKEVPEECLLQLVRSPRFGKWLLKNRHFFQRIKELSPEVVQALMNNETANAAMRQFLKETPNATIEYPSNYAGPRIELEATE